MNKLHAHIARVNTIHNEGRAEKGGNGEILSGQRLQNTFRIRGSDIERIKERRHNTKRDRKVRFEGVPENGSVNGSLPCCPETLASDVRILARRIGTLKREVEKIKQMLENVQ
ncbi:hypothetical protein N7533_010591 [Penicillium manginii]|uniref:uncharacterized protein n=1 Tax=Penicillium manginii TaxID=203109 RepID=UPI00254708D5|nr:uncharacterized protein N7533_010591 [Penicillium manginii]KAJ5743489.1 hypothetical protein N7533_010591 [Penicillium manginii]